MRKATRHDIQNASLVGLVIGIIGVAVGLSGYTFGGSAFAKTLPIILFHELWLLTDLFNYNWSVSTYLVIHVSYSIILANVVMMLFRVVRPHAHSGPNACSTCQYDLTGNESGTCPECGTTVTPPNHAEAAG